MTKPIMIGIGEVLWDLLPGGKVLGGAPANFACHANALGGQGVVVSAVGQDALGDEILAVLSSAGISTTPLVQYSDRPTGTVGVTLDSEGKPSYDIYEGVAWDALELNESSLTEATRADAVCFGSLAQRAETSRSAIQAFLKATPASCLRVFDINLRQNFYSKSVIQESLALASALKINDEELPLLAEIEGLSGDDESILGEIVARYNLRVAALTLGPEGSLLVTKDGEAVKSPSPDVTVVDSIGAGDSFTATFAMGILAGLPLAEVGQRANAVAAFVCSQAGATPKLPDDLRFNP